MSLEENKNAAYTLLNGVQTHVSALTIPGRGQISTNKEILAKLNQAKGAIDGAGSIDDVYEALRWFATKVGSLNIHQPFKDLAAQVEFGELRDAKDILTRFNTLIGQTPPTAPSSSGGAGPSQGPGPS